ncbi:RNA polymerase, sigma-24 subunit, RpoE, ECF subfamily [Actinobacteria bacterium OK006]|jgi:RNA polymerase sigma-70 factor (ECF subfamily)|uniref:RNA polymerase subunit sigma-70 n=4 Tax=Streptomyces TaxID=1883 RepID=UPI0006CDAF35|nr:RNA polymerase, sigma-24 subunit, RpoE, ECF subfamily [Actinobacteria bacterium OK006]
MSIGMGDFATDTEPYRRELLAHCYRMLGSVDDAEDVVQETYLRAWRSYEAFQGRSSVRTWLHRIATNACLSALSHRSRRFLPSGLGGPADDPMNPPMAAEVQWVQPIPDSMLDPAAIVAARDSLRIALIATLQELPGRQRAVFILRDVLAWPAADVAQVMGSSTAAVKSTLQRARARLAQTPPDVEQTVEPGELSAVLAHYIAAVEEADGTALEQLLRVDARVEATPWRTWFSGRATCLPFLVQQVLGSPGTWRLLPTSANGQPAAVAYHGGQAYGILLLTVTPAGIARINAFGDPGLVKRFGFPASV